MQHQDLALRYPIGKYTKPTSFSNAEMHAWMNEIAIFPKELAKLVDGLTATEKALQYRKDGWTIAQVVNHCADSHLNAYIRFKLAMTEDSPTIKPYNEASWAMLADGTNDHLEPSLSILKGVHEKWLVLLRSFTEADWERTYTHPEHQKTFPLKEILALYAWHCQHHLAHIRLALAGK